VREDLFYAFERSRDSGLEEPMATYVGDLISRIQGGMPIDTALSLFQDCNKQEQFQDFVIAIRFNFRYQGNIVSLMDTLELQVNQVEEEYIRRRISSSRDRGLTVMIMLAAPLLYLFILLRDSLNRHFFFATTMGGGSLIIAILIYLVGLTLFWSVSRQSI
jgi:Flp pilus assembly protein TadB